MYNRYIPQQDGSYQKNRMPTPQPKPSPPPTPHQQPPAMPSYSPPPPMDIQPPHRQPNGAFDFLRQLLPKNLDTGDLLIIVLLLLMAGDGKDNQTWLLTLALYLFL